MLRGLRIAARLGLSISRETDTAIRSLASSIKSLDQVILEECSKSAVLTGCFMIWVFYFFIVFYFCLFSAVEQALLPKLVVLYRTLWVFCMISNASYGILGCLTELIGSIGQITWFSIAILVYSLNNIVLFVCSVQDNVGAELYAVLWIC